MTDHADTIRRCLRLRGADEETTIAFAALDALLAELQQAQKERDDWQTLAARQLEEFTIRTREIHHERQQAIDALREIRSPRQLPLLERGVTVSTTDSVIRTKYQLRSEFNQIMDDLESGLRILPGSTYRDPDLTPAQQRLTAKRLRDLAERLDRV